MTVTYQSFIDQFKEFADPSIYDDASVTLYIELGVNFQNASRWDLSVIDLGTSYFAAHFLVLQARDVMAARAGGIPGEVQGPKTASAVDKVSKSMDPKIVTLENGAFWNMTTYGVRFLYFARIYGTGGVQTGTGPCGPGWGGGWVF